MSKLLFDPSLVDAGHLEPKAHDVKSYDHLSVSGKPYAYRVRSLLEEWFASYPDEEKHELRRRMQSKEGEFYSAFFELFLYATFLRLGAAVEIHPDVSEEITKHPDFLITLQSGYEFYLEAIAASDKSETEIAAENAKNTLYQLIDRKLKSPDYMYQITVHSQSKVAPKGRQVIHELAQWQSGLDIDTVRSAFVAQGFNTEYRYIFSGDGWVIEFVPLPKSDEARTKEESGRPLGVFSMPRAVCPRDEEDIRAAYKYKIDYHPTLDRPYMIACAATGDFAQMEDFKHAIFGSTGFQFDASGNPTAVPMGNGIWCGDNAPKNDHLVGVIGVLHLSPTSVNRATVQVFDNPYIDKVADLAQIGFPHWVGDDGKLKLTSGRTSGEIHGLDEGWPSIE